MTDYIKREDAIFIALQQPFFQNSMATEIRQIKGIDIVRCKECKHLQYEKSRTHGIVYCCGNLHDEYGFYRVVKPDDFCSYGEREGER